MALTVGIIGLPLSGKTTVFNALTRAGAEISGYPTSTVQANRAVVQVPDERLARLAEIFHPRKIVPTAIEFVDVAGIGQGSEETRKQGLSAEFLGHIRNADALALVVRCFENAAAPHPGGSIDAVRDLDELLSELALTDLATVERRIESTQRKTKTGDKKAVEELELLRGLREHLNEGRPASEYSFSSNDEAVLRELFLLTMKPRLYVVNVSEDALGAAGELLEQQAPAAGQSGELACVAAVGERARAEGAEVVAVSAKLEAELGELAEADAAEYLEALGLPQTWLGSRSAGGVSRAEPHLVPHSWRGRGARLDDHARDESAGGGGQDSHRHRAWLHSRGGRALRRPDARQRVDEDRQGARARPPGGQGLRRARRGHHRVPLQRLQVTSRSGRSSQRAMKTPVSWRIVSAPSAAMRSSTSARKATSSRSRSDAWPADDGAIRATISSSTQRLAR